MMVFSTMMQITKDYIESHPQLGEISFSSKKHHPSRVKLYDTIARTLEKRYGYEVEIDDSQDKDVYYIVTIK